MRIQQLAPELANQIAAGEVIERPASVVKELLENALDAGASNVSIDIGFGGLNHITISDNGLGICAEDMHLAIAAHATSKISQLTDLYQITTMGFRGEALASIASVSRLSVHSKPAQQAHAMMISVDEFGVALRPCARTQGTTVDVRDLFYNAPVRKAFLKSERVEYQAIEWVVKQFALSAPSISVTLKHNGKLSLNLPAAMCEQSRLRRIKKLFGQAFLDDAVYLDENHAYFSIQGWMSQRHYQRSQRDRQWVYLNQRFIKDKLIHQAIGQVYQGLLHPGRYPSCLFYISIDSEQVDVNVHPTKHEVRFRDPRMVHSMLVSMMSKPLQRVEAPIPVLETTGARPDQAVHEPSSTLRFLNQSAPAHHSNDITTINSHFMLIHSAHAAPMLVNMQQVQQAALWDELADATLPWGSRPLLVPVRVAIDPSMYTTFEKHQAVLAEYGVQYDFMSASIVMIRSIPLCVPLLDIASFIASIPATGGHPAAIVQSIIDCQCFDLYTLSSIQKEALLAYYRQHQSETARIQACGLRLEIEACEKIIQQKHRYE